MFPNAIYAAQLTGSAGPTFALFIFHDGRITGADGGEAIYDGTYYLTNDDQGIAGAVTVTIPPNVPSITTGVAHPEPFTVRFELPVELDPEVSYSIQTPTGPIQIKFKKLREIY